MFDAHAPHGYTRAASAPCADIRPSREIPRHSGQGRVSRAASRNFASSGARHAESRNFAAGAFVHAAAAGGGRAWCAGQVAKFCTSGDVMA